MKPLLKSLIIEFVLLVTVFIALLTIFIVVLLIACWLTGTKPTLKPSFDIQLHDTYLVLSWQTIILQPYLMVITLIYLVKELRHGFKRPIQNVTLVISNFYLITLLSKLFSLTAILKLNQSWSVYPPLTEPQKVTMPVSYNSHIQFIEQIIFFVLIFFLATLVISAFLTGKNWKPASHETKT